MVSIRRTDQGSSWAVAHAEEEGGKAANIKHGREKRNAFKISVGNSEGKD
jgi:hypothetical protein